jgi:hypothetical protein
MSESMFSKGTSQSYYDMVKKGSNPSILSNNGSKLARSDSFWKQQNNLMVEIFKHKLTFNPK